LLAYSQNEQKTTFLSEQLQNNAQNEIFLIFLVRKSPIHGAFIIWKWQIIIYNLYYLIPYRILINTYFILSSLNYSCLPYVRSALVCCPPPPAPPPIRPALTLILMHHVPCCTTSCPVQSPPCRVVPCPCLLLSHRSPTENNPRLCGRPAGHQHCTVLLLPLLYQIFSYHLRCILITWLCCCSNAGNKYYILYPIS
jgi:hypothetical protein